MVSYTYDAMNRMTSVTGLDGDVLDYHIKCNTAPKKERHCVRFVLE